MQIDSLQIRVFPKDGVKLPGLIEIPVQFPVERLNLIKSRRKALLITVSMALLAQKRKTIFQKHRVVIGLGGCETA
jgi:hypothetical protein